MPRTRRKGERGEYRLFGSDRREAARAHVGVIAQTEVSGVETLVQATQGQREGPHLLFGPCLECGVQAAQLHLT
jgi:hypothetical protein